MISIQETNQIGNNDLRSLRAYKEDHCFLTLG